MLFRSSHIPYYASDVSFKAAEAIAKAKDEANARKLAALESIAASLKILADAVQEKK